MLSLSLSLYLHTGYIGGNGAGRENVGGLRVTMFRIAWVLCKGFGGG